MPARSSSRSTKSTSKVVKYTGPHNAKTITKADWKAIDVKDQETVTWDWRNDWAISVKEFSEVALNYCKNLDPNLKIIDIERDDDDDEASD